LPARAKALSALVVILAVSASLGMMSMRFEKAGSEEPTACAQAKNQTFYVALDGDDASPGTINQPWRTIQRAADTLEPGDMVYIRGGVYEEYVELSQGGSYGNYITYAAYPGETPILDGENVDWKYGFNLGHEYYIKIDGLVIRNWEGFGIVSWTQSDHIVIKNVEIYNTGSAIRLFDHHDDWIVENAYLHHNSLIGFDCAPGPGTNIVLRNVQSMYNGVGGDTAADGFAFESGNSVLVEDCEASYNGGDGFDFKSDGTQLVCVVAHDNGRNNIKLWGKNSRLINALSYDSGLTNLVLAEGGSYHVINCLVASQSSYGYLATLGGYDTLTPTPVVLYNNIFYNDNPVMGGTTVYFPAGAILTADNNIYWNPFRTDAVICAEFAGGCFSSDDIKDGTWYASSGSDANSAYGNPLFVDAKGKDFHLTAESPAVDAGNPVVAPNSDLEGISRPQKGGVDIGPYELSQTSNNPLTLVMELDTNKYKAGQQMNIALRLTNGGHSEVVLVFPTSQTFDFQVLEESGREVYKWSSERFFLAAITTVTLKPGETLERSLTWAIDLEPGSYLVIGMTTSFTADGSSTTLQTPRTVIQVTSSTVEYQEGK